MEYCQCGRYKEVAKNLRFANPGVPTSSEPPPEVPAGWGKRWSKRRIDPLVSLEFERPAFFPGGSAISSTGEVSPRWIPFGDGVSLKDVKRNENRNLVDSPY
ncbi:unnamed protein product [Phyllotreta striolata]|uniref:Uncharacterized protein n=1 Tax=Phyllotreta striolata TaxID=444603 RepID=A0A9N9TF71_PHYSR|nr:unnamed protein product [Phyllotreta striolata]